VNPDDIVLEFGADSMRIYEMFMGPLEAAKPWNTSSIAGVRRFLDRVFTVTLRADESARADDALTRLLHQTIRKVTDDIEAMRFNTAISTMMVLTNELMKLEQVPTEALDVLATLLHPFAPHLGEEVWERLGHPPSIQTQPWPTYDPALCEEDEVEVPVQINGKVRGRIQLPKDATEAQALAAAQEALPTQLEGKPLRKTIWVPNKILNLIV
jgi:leucyl-tRNA synthetase